MRMLEQERRHVVQRFRCKGKKKDKKKTTLYQPSRSALFDLLSSSFTISFLPISFFLVTKKRLGLSNWTMFESLTSLVDDDDVFFFLLFRIAVVQLSYHLKLF